MGEGLDGHLAAHHIHRCLADEAAAEHQAIKAKRLKFLCHCETVVDFETALESVAHIRLGNDGNLALRSFESLVDTHAHKPHTIVERAAKLVAAMIGIWRKELAYQISVAGMDFNTVEAGIDGQPHSIAEVAGNVADFVLREAAHKCWRIKVEARRRAHRSLSANGAVRHVSAVTELYRHLGTFGMDGISEVAKLRHNFLTHPQLTRKRKAAARNGSICYGGHSYSSPRH